MNRIATAALWVGLAMLSIGFLAVLWAMVELFIITNTMFDTLEDALELRRQAQEVPHG